MAAQTSRRAFFAKGFQALSLSAVGGILWSGYAKDAKAAPLALRPPGAIEESQFVEACIRCGLCAEACRNRPSNKNKDGSTREATLKIATGGESKLIGTPFFEPEDVPCYMCDDIPCVPVCPSGALDIKTLLNEKKELDIDKARMGLAVVHKESCVAYWGLQCDACYRACPLLDEAITLEYHKNERTGKHAFLLPVVHSDVCTGCGLCEKACITQKPAIFVLPIDKATGIAGDHYVKGWDQNDQQRVGQAKAIETRNERSEEKPADYLNMEVEY